VFTYSRLGRAIVLVTDDQLSLAIGRRGQNVRLASKLVGWDIEIMTHDELGEALERAERWFGQLPHASPELTSALIEDGFLSYNDLTCIDAPALAEFSGLNEEQADEVIMYAEEYADVMEKSVEEERRAAEEAAEVARLEAEAQAQAEAEAAEAAAAAAGETGEPGDMAGESGAVLGEPGDVTGEPGDVSPPEGEAAEANSEPVAVSSGDQGAGETGEPGDVSPPEQGEPAPEEATGRPTA
jgi:N utilization substance protein A